MTIDILQPDGATIPFDDDYYVDLSSSEDINSPIMLHALSSGGSGDSPYCTYLVQVTPFNDVSATNPPELTTVNNHPVLVFPKTADNTAYFECVMPCVGSLGYPASWGVSHQWNGYYYVHLHWTIPTGGTATWKIAFENMTGGNVDTDDFDHGELTVTDTVDTANEVIISTIEVSVAQIHGSDIDAIELFRLRVKRNNSGTTDDAYLVAIDIQGHWIEPIV